MQFVLCSLVGCVFADLSNRNFWPLLFQWFISWVLFFFFIIFGCCMFLLPVSKISLSCFRSKGRKLHMLECLTLQKQQIDLWYILVDKSWHFPRHLYDCYNVTLWRSSVCSLLLIHSFVRCSLLNLTLFSTLPFSQNNDTLLSACSVDITVIIWKYFAAYHIPHNPLENREMCI